MKEAASSSQSATQPAVSPVEIPPDELNRLVDLYERGLYLRAHALAQRFGPLETWRGTDAQVLAGRLAAHLGAGRLGRRLHMRAWRHNRTHPEARYYFGWAVLEYRGPLEAWRVLKSFGDLLDAEPIVRSDLFSLRARAACLLRDFATAEHWLAEADKLAPQRAWLLVERAFLLESEDRYEEALSASRRALELRPWYRPAVQSVAHGLQLLGRNEEALEFLVEASARLESGSVVAQLAALQVETQRFSDARKSLGRCAELSPLMEKEFAQWLAARRSDAAYFDGDFVEAASFAKQADHPLYQEMAERLPNLSGSGRVQLPVAFVRQHHMTCAPATLSAISRFWQKPAEHLTLAEAICYDGTPAHSERRWAEQNGWRTSEFKVTWESAVALVDRRVPFTLTTVEPGSAHLQAVIGYDTHRRSLIVRDPFVHEVREFHAGNTFERYQSTGPRGMALVPQAQAAMIDDVPLPEAELYDPFYEMQRALDGHDRPRALDWLERMKAVAPEHRLTLTARRTLATYDANQTEILASVDKLLELFPSDANLQLSRLSCLRELARREERVAWLKKICESKESDPLLWMEYAWELSADAREQGQALRSLKRVLRCRPTHANGIYQFAGLLWNQRQFARATELYRFAASLEDKKEHLARAYFSASRFLKQTDAALAFLADRFRRFGKSSGQPAMTLFGAHSQLDQMSAAFLVLEAAMELRPDDPELRLFAADAYARYADYARAENLLREAEGRSQRTAWLRTAAGLALLRDQPARALEMWREVLDSEPLALDAHRHVARLLAETEGRESALRHLEQTCARFPHHFALHQLWNEWLRDESAQAMEPVVRKLVEINSADAWAQRELAIMLARQRRFPEALAAADHAISLDPNGTFSHGTRAWIHKAAGNIPAALADYRHAITLSVDNNDAITGLLDACDSMAARREAVAFVEQELIRQVVFGDGLLAFREVARPVMAKDELLASLRTAHRERPDLWHAWSALVQQLADMQQFDEALALGREATARFPLVPRLWLDLALVHRARLDRQKEIEALEQAVQISPHWVFAARELALALERAGQLTRGRAILEQAVARAPLDCFNHGCLAEVLWKLEEKKAAVERLQHALRLNPGYEWGWGTLRRWSQELREPQLAAQMARALTERRGGEVRSWLLLAESLSRPEELAERLSALDRATALDPRSIEAHDLRAVVLAEAERYEEALAAGAPAVWGDQRPTELRARTAWVEARRGNTTVAIALMRAALAENPGLYWGWRELADWLWKEGAYQESREAAEKMAWLTPMNAVPLGYLGDIKLRLSDRAGAKADFRRAMELDPNYLYAGYTLFDCQLEDGELDAAGQTLGWLREHAEPELVRAREAQLASRRGNKGEALGALRALCTSPADNPSAIHAAADSVVQAGWARDAEEMFVEVMKLAEANPQVGALWVDRRAASGKWRCLRQLDELHQRGEIGRRAIINYVERLAEACQSLRARRDVFGPFWCRRRFWWLMPRHRQWLQADDWAWGKVGYALICFGEFRAALKWLKDWRSRARAEPWMLLNLVWLLQRKGRDAEAQAVVQHALTIPDGDAAKVRFRLWAAIEEALARNVLVASRRLVGLKPERLDDYDKKLHALATLLLEFQPPDGAKRKFGASHRRTLREFLNVHQHNRGAIRMFYRSVRLIARQTGSQWPLIWGYSLQWLPVFIGLVIAGAYIWLKEWAKR